MKAATLKAATDHALECYPRESCGLVAVIKGRERYVPCTNLATKAAHFTIDPAQYAATEDIGKVTRIVHSHPDVGALPSEADLVMCEASELPWSIVAVHMDAGEDTPRFVAVHDFNPCGYEADLIGREFTYGILDCFTLVQDWYLRNRGVVLTRPAEDEYDWWYKGKDLYVKNFAAQGFVETTEKELETGDLILMQIPQPGRGEPDINHAAVYIDNTRILQHVYGKLSSRDVYGGYWRETTRMFLHYAGDGHVK